MLTFACKKRAGILAKTASLLIATVLALSFMPLTSAYADDAVEVDAGEPGEVHPQNPYSKNCTVTVQIGEEFATYEMDGYSEGYVYKLADGETDVTLPKLKAKDGYTFVGWSQGGVTDPTWDALTDVVTIEDDPSLAGTSRAATIYALFADEEGNGYCTCGAYGENFYAENLDVYKAVYKEYLDKNFPGFTLKTFGVIAGMSFMLLLIFVVFYVVITQIAEKMFRR